MIELKEVTSLCGGNLVSCFVLAKALKGFITIHSTQCVL